MCKKLEFSNKFLGKTSGCKRWGEIEVAERHTVSGRWSEIPGHLGDSEVDRTRARIPGKVCARVAVTWCLGIV